MTDFSLIDDIVDTDENQESGTSDDFVIEFYGESELRWYQVAARNALAAELEQGTKRVLIELPTGAGKTLTIACSMSNPRIRAALGVTGNRKLRVLFVAHKHRLLSQAEKTFIDSSDVELITHSMFQRIPNSLIQDGWDVCVLDESHHEACSTFQFHLEQLGEMPIIGLTATPDRADGCVIKFEAIINPISREQAVAEGYLAPTFLNSIIDAPSASKTEITKMVIDKFGDDFGQTMMFFRTKKEVRDVTAYLVETGYKAVSILDQSERELDETLDGFSKGDYQFVVNCNKINEGVDVKGCTDVYLGRAYGSYPQLNQVIGRAARPDSECRVWELINPLPGRNLDTTVVVGTPERHRLISKRKGEWVEHQFDYVSTVREFSEAPSMSFGAARRAARAA